MKILNKMNFTVCALSFASVATFGLLACSADESTSVSPKSESPFMDLDSLVIPDSILESDSLFTWYIEKVVSQKKSSSSKKTSGSSSSVKNSDDDSDKSSTSKSSSSKGSSTKDSSASKDDPAESSSAKSSSSGKNNSSSENSESSDSSETVETEEPYDLSPVLLPPGGFFKELTLPLPAPQKDCNIVCFAINSEYGGFEQILVDKPYTLTKNTVVSCKEYNKDGDVTRKSTQSFFMNEAIKMPVVSITVDTAFFHEKYVYDDACEGGDPYRPVCKGIMVDAEYPVHVEFFEKGSRSNGKAWEIDAGISLMGQYSRTYEKKPVAIKMKKEYQEGSLKYPIFDVRPDRKKFKGFNLRNGGNRFVGDYVGDPVLTSLVEGSSVDYQRSREVVVFYNGVYYGIHDMRERLNEHFVETNYKGIDSKDVDFIKQKKDTVTASGGTIDSYMNLLSFIAANDFSGENNEAYEKLHDLMDVNNYADYMAAQIYCRNADWPSNNVRAWRSTNQPFKFVLFDLDQCFGWDWVSDDFKMNKGTMFSWIRNDRGSGRTGPGYFANIYIKVSQNPDFRRLFANHGAVMLNDYLTYERLSASLEKINSQLDPDEIERDQSRFVRRYSPYGGGEGHFDKTGFHLLDFGLTRTQNTREEYRAEFSLGDDISVTIAASGSGSVTLDGMNLPRKNYTGTFFEGNGMLLQAIPDDGAVFVGWSDGVTENPRLVLPADGDTFEAKFK